MKRSEINKALKDMHDLIKKFHVSLPPFCEWTPEEWKTKGKEYDEIRDNMLGWDIQILDSEILNIQDFR